MANPLGMRNRTLQLALREFTEEAAWQLAADSAGGVDVPFEVVESRGSRTPLYCYRPLTNDFIRTRIGVLGRLPSYAGAARALESIGGVDAYLRLRGEPRIPAEPRERADAALRSFLGAVFDDAGDFAFSEERFARAYEEVESAIYAARAVFVVVAPLLGLELRSPEVPIGTGLALVRGDALQDAPAEAVWSASDAERPNVLAVLTHEGEPGVPVPLAAARVRLRRLLSALRLYEDGGFALGPAAWARLDQGPWRLVPLHGSGRAHGHPLVVAPDEEDALRGFVNLVARRTPSDGEVAWALGRFDMGCERLAPFEALTDFLLALRALLEPEGPSSGRVAQRLAAICAVADRRPALAERVAHAISLERAVISGLPPAEGAADRLVSDVAGHLRALLRDVLCGHLDGDLKGLADRILEEAAGAREPTPAPLEPGTTRSDDRARPPVESSAAPAAAPPARPRDLVGPLDDPPEIEARRGAGLLQRLRERALGEPVWEHDGPPRIDQRF